MNTLSISVRRCTQFSIFFAALHAPTLSAQNDGSGLVLEEVMVVAQKREESLLDAPLSVTSLSSAAMERRGIQGLNDLQTGAIPSLKISQYANNPATLVIAMRGQTAPDAGSIATESPVGIYVDGVYLGRAQGLAADAMDLERIEILRGPQGTLYGRNTIGGVVHLITQKPSGEWGFKQDLMFGDDYGQWRSVSRIDFPALGNLKARLNYLHYEHEGYVENPAQANLLANENFNAKDQDGFRLALRWDSDAMVADYSFEWSETQPTQGYFQFGGASIPEEVLADPARRPTGFDSVNGIPRSIATACGVAAPNVQPDFGLPACVPALTAVADPTIPYITREDGRSRPDEARVPLYLDRSNIEVFGHTLSLDVPITDEWSFKSITSYRTLEQNLITNFNGALVGLGLGSGPDGDTLDQKQYSQEFQFIGDALNDTLQYVGGLYYFREEADEAQATLHQVYEYIEFPGDIGFLPFAPLPIVDDVTGNPTSLPVPAQLTENPFNSVVAFESTSWAVFGQTTYHFTDSVNGTLGARWTEDKREGSTSVRNFVDLAEPIVRSNDDGNFDWSATLSWSPNDTTNTYLRYATGYKSGGVSRRAINLDPFEKETVEAWELGLKTRLLDGRMTFNSAVFLTNFEDRQATLSEILLNPEATVANSVDVNSVGTTEISGLEFEAAFVVASGLTVGLDYTYLDAQSPDQPNISLPNSDPDFDPTRDIFLNVATPRHSGTLSIDYQLPRLPIGLLALHFDWNSQSRQYLANRSFEDADAFDVMNARLTLSEVEIGAGELRASLWAKNLTDEEYLVSLTSFPNYPRVWSEPRTMGIDLTYEF